MELPVWTHVLQIIGPTAVIGLIFWIRTLISKMEGISAKLNAMDTHNVEQHKILKRHFDHTEVEFSREHKDLMYKVNDLKDTLMERVEKMLTDHNVHEQQTGRIEVKVDELVSKSRNEKQPS